MHTQHGHIRSALSLPIFSISIGLPQVHSINPNQMINSLVPPSKLTLSASDGGAVAPLSRVSVTCDADAAMPPAVILWRHNSQLLTTQTDYDDRAWRIKSVLVLGGDAAQYYSSSTLSFQPSLHHNDTVFDCVTYYQHNIQLVSAESYLLVLKGNQTTDRCITRESIMTAIFHLSRV
jgi:hypothetical protein